jgi:hypothetical protein
MIEPLSTEETSIGGVAPVLRAAVADDARGLLDDSAGAKAQHSLVLRISELARALADHDPYLRQDWTRDLDVLAARDAVRRLTDAAAVWLRTLNALHADDCEQARAGNPDDRRI